MKRPILAAFFIMAAQSHAAISLSASNTTGVQTFATAPPAADWSTASIAGASGNYTTVAQVDAGVQTLAATAITNSLVAATVPAANALAIYSGTGATGLIYTAPTGNNATVLMATLQNDYGSAATSINITYDFTRTGTAVAEEVIGHRVYYSLTGLINSWTAIPALSGISTNQTLTASVTLTSAWANGAKLYLLWADDNGSGSPDTAFTIDNFSLTTGTPNTPPTVSISAPAAGSFATAPGSFTINATASDNGSVTQVEFLRNGTVVGTDTTSPYSFADSGLAAGAYTYTARATDNLGATTTSAPVSVNVFTDPTNTALQFNGVNNYVTMGAATATLGTPVYTLECWFKRTGTGVGASTGSNGLASAIPLVTKGRAEADATATVEEPKDCNYFMGINSATNQLCADFEAKLQTPLNGTGAGNNNYPVIGSTVLSNNIWYHAAAVWDGSAWKLYINGVEETTTSPNLLPVPSPIPQSASIQHFALGTALDSTGTAAGFFQGVIDEARVWNLARTTAQILAFKDAPIATATTGLLARFGLNEGTGTGTSNSVGVAGAPIGTLTNDPVWVDGAPMFVNTPPTVSLTSPTVAYSGVAPATVSFAATAADPGGSVTKVEFFQGATKVGEDLTAPYTFDWTSVAPGTYSLTAKATDNAGAVTTSSAVSITVSPNPNQPTVVTPGGPADNATGLGSSTALSLGLADPEGDAQTVIFYGRKTSPAAPGPDFSIATLPDTQFYSENLNNNNQAATYYAQTQWLVDNCNTLNLAFVSHMGDIVQNGDAVPAEWVVADTAMKKIESQADTLRAYGIPWGAAPGNHDQTSLGNAGGANAYFGQYFGASRYVGRNYWGGSQSPTNNNNNYQLFSASGLDFIIVHMEYDVRAKASYQVILDWADALLKAYPNRRAIITSHWIINTGNPATFSAQGQDIYDALKNNPNLFLMLCGHVPGEGQRSDTFQGRTVYSVLQDYQGRVNGGDGWLRYFVFSPANNTISAKTYRVSNPVNPAAGAYETDTDSQFTLAYNMQGAVTDWIPLGTVNVLANGTTASLNWTGLEAGSNYEWYATSNDGINLTTTPSRRFSTAANAAPSVALTAPLDGTGAALNTTISLAATAADSDGTIVRVEFYDGATKLSTVTSGPYTFDWIGATAGNHVLTAVAVDNSGATTLSGVVNLNVFNVPPTVALTEPDPGQIFDAPASVYMSANAADTDGTVVKVEYYANSIKIGEASVAPYALFWNNVFTGSYTLTAKATDNSGGFTISAPLSISVTNVDNVPPTVAITAPAAGLTPSGTITIHASASDSDGTVAKVEFYNGATKLGESTTAPYSFTWNGASVGSHTLSAVATDNDAGVTTSPLVIINVQPPPLSFSENFDSMGTAGTSPPSNWSFFGYTIGSNTTWASSVPASDVAGGTANATLIQTTTFDVANTKSATQGYNFALSASPADRALGTSPTSTEGVALQWSVTNTSGSGITSIRLGYDIRRFTAPATANELPGYWVFYSLDNGTTWSAVSALNPTLAGPTGVIVPNTVGVTTVTPTDITLNGSWAAGSTLLLRWVDDNALETSADQIIGLDNVTLVSVGAQIGQPPSVTLTAPIATDPFSAPATIALAATANDSDGTVAKVEFFQGATKLGEVSTAPYTFNWSGAPVGTYSLTARATDNDGNVTVSAATSISVSATAGSGTLTRAAYLQQAAPTTMTIRWRSSQSIAGRVKFGPSAASLTSTANEASSTTDHEVTLTGLTANTVYFYSIGSAVDTLAGADAAHTFTTPPTTGSTPNTRVWILGDAGTGTANQIAVRDAFYAWTGARDPNLVLQLGDNAYNSGLDSEFQSNVFNIYGSLMKRVPFWSCLGNHETNQATSFVDTYPYFSIYTFPKTGQCGGVASGTEHYYSFDYGNVHFISLDSMTASRSATGAMATWLTADLASNTQTWVVAFFHHPPYTKGSHDSDTETELIEMRSNLLPILENGGVDLVLSGHSHSYERSYLLDGHYGLSTTLTAAMKKNAGNGRPAGTGAYIKPLTGPRDHFGAVYAVAGSSGQTSGGSLNHPAHFISLNNLGSLVLDVNGTRLDATFVRENGSLPDTFTMIKQGAADTDGDGIPDAYEMSHGLDRKNPSDAATIIAGSSGLTNFLEFAFGLTPHVNDSSPVQVDVPGAVLTQRGTPAVWYQTTTNGTDFRVIFIRRKDAADAGLVYTPQFSGDLLTWANSSVSPTVVADGGEVEAVSIDYPFFAAGQKARFFRVAVSTTH